jgi:hypothetical protein
MTSQRLLTGCNIDFTTQYQNMTIILTQMKKSILILFCALTQTLFSQSPQEIEIKSEVNEVTVYLTGAQVTRFKSVNIPLGRSTIRFTNLSPFIDSKSISIKAKGEFTILSVNLQQNFLTPQSKSKENEDLLKNKQDLENKIKTESAYLDILNEELAFLKANSSIGGANVGTSLTSLKEADTYFSEKITSIKLKQIDRQSNLEQFTKDLDKVENQLASLASKKEFPTGEIIVNINSRAVTEATFEIKYLVSNAGWTPSYDIKVKNIELPADLTYKANVHQYTNEDWRNIQLKLSSSDPNTSNTYREPQPYFLNYNSVPPSYRTNINQVSGHIYDIDTEEPLPYATVMVKGTSIGTVTDINGAYSISIPQNGGQLIISYVGYTQVESPITNQLMDFHMKTAALALQEVTVVGFGSAKKSSQERALGFNGDKTTIRTPESYKNSNIVETGYLANQTSIEFEIKTPYTIPSDGKNLTIDIASYSLPANYQYFCTPKVDKNVYLLAQIVDWEKYNLLEGEANVFFEDTYTGKTLLDIRYMSDTLTISLGNDKGVSINREIQRQYTTRQFLGNKKEETKTWLISIKNNKQQSINISILDQIPVSTLEEIQVNALDLSNGKLDPETGIIKWDLQLKPAEKKEFDLKYSVQYPKYRTLIIE